MDDRVRLESTVYRRAMLIQPRVFAALLLILGGVGWAVARGLAFYGVGPAELGYDLDQPPVLLLLVGVWLIYRGRRP
jgi:hypothetical protein